MPKATPLSMYAININANVRIWQQFPTNGSLRGRTLGALEVILDVRSPKTVAYQVFRAAAFNENRDHLRFLLDHLHIDRFALITLNNKQALFVRELERLMA